MEIDCVNDGGVSLICHHDCQFVCRNVPATSEIAEFVIEAGRYTVRLDITEMNRLLLFAQMMDQKSPWHRRAESLLAKRGGAA